MKNCVNCGREISDTAKFCGYCRAKQDVEETKAPVAEGRVCPSCRNVNSATAQFCHSCGQRLTPVEVAPEEADGGVDKQRGFITWSVLPGQLAVKIDEKEIDSYGIIRGLYVAPGTKALFFVNGKYAATLDSGRYSFGELRQEAGEEPKTEKKGVLSFLKNVAHHIANGVATLFGMSDKPFYSVILCRGNEFPLVYDFANVRTGAVSSDVGLHLVARISNINTFAESLMTDRKFISLEAMAKLLQPYIATVVNQTFLSLHPDQINEGSDSMLELLKAMTARVGQMYPYIELVQVLSATARNEELENLRKLKEELYIKEQELEQVQLRNDFLNRLQDAERSNALRNARSDVEYQALLDEIELEGLKNEDKKEQVVLMLMAERQLRLARTQEEMAQAMDKLRQSRMLSEEELSVLREQINHRAAMVRIGNNQEIAMAQLENGQLLAMATIRNQVALDGEKLKWELEIGNRRFENQLWRQRQENQLKNEERDADFDFEQRQAAAQMNLLRQAQALRMERDNAEHARKMDEIRTRNELEQAKLDNDLEKVKVMSGLSFEQIMALNPDISPAAAAALAEKFKAEAAAAGNEQYNALMDRYISDMRAVGQQNLETVRQLAQAQAYTQADRLQDKQAELDRVHQMSERNTDRVLTSVQTTVNAVTGQPRIITAPAPVVGVGGWSCPGCGTKNPKDSAFCEGCGASNK